MWLLPAILPSPITIISSFKLNVYLGMSLNSTLQITNPNIYNEDMNNSEKTMSVFDIDLDEGYVHCSGTIQLESVIRIEFEDLEDEEKARGMFADEVLRAILHMDTSTSWILRNIILSSGITDVSTEKENKTNKTISGENIGKNLNLLAAMRRLMIKYGEVIIETAFAMSYDEALLPYTDLLEILERAYLKGKAKTELSSNNSKSSLHSKANTKKVYIYLLSLLFFSS